MRSDSSLPAHDQDLCRNLHAAVLFEMDGGGSSWFPICPGRVVDGVGYSKRFWKRIANKPVYGTTGAQK
eukprot:7225075-Pyramimonas_sp.AAC.1